LESCFEVKIITLKFTLFNIKKNLRFLNINKAVSYGNTIFKKFSLNSILFSLELAILYPEEIHNGINPVEFVDKNFN